MTWDGAPDVVFKRPDKGGQRLWHSAWVDHAQEYSFRRQAAFVIAHTGGTGVLSQGTSDWKNYQVSADVVTHLAAAGGIAAYVQGINRYYALLLCDDQHVRLVKRRDEQVTLAEAPFKWEINQPYKLTLQVEDDCLQGWVNGQAFFNLRDTDDPLPNGGVGLVCADGSIMTDSVSVKPVRNSRS